MNKMKSLPVALTIAGSDSGGGAGIQADLKTFTAIGCHGATAITCITAQNPKGVLGIQPIRADMVRKQIEAVFTELPPRAVKTGMLFSTEIIRVVAELFTQGKHPPLIVDPVMVATSGAVLLKPSAIIALKRQLLPLATLVTPNLDEAKLLVGRNLFTIEHLKHAALELHERHGCAVLLKGGHLNLRSEAIDVFYDGRVMCELNARRVRGVSTHGTGCTYSAAIAANLAHGETLFSAVKLAKGFITTAISESYTAGKHPVLNHQAR
jgi:hydroxymethylpyrimidine/phosphomethylpyrimidine kinase